jgi:hypothetical protein
VVLVAALLGFNVPTVEGAGNHLDYTFSSNGKLTTVYGQEASEATAVAVQPDGKIVVVVRTDVGGGGNNFAVFRYNADGTLDTSFSQQANA